MSWRGEYFRAAGCTRESAIFGRERETTNTRGGSIQSRTVEFQQKSRRELSVVCTGAGSLTRSLFTDEIMEHRYFRPVTQLPLSRERKYKKEEEERKKICRWNEIRGVNQIGE